VVRRIVVTLLVLGALAFLGYATLVSHAQRPCIEPNLTTACKKYLRTSGK
jgi:hypothetical protein